VLRGQVAPAIALHPTLLTLVVGSNDVASTAPDQFRHTYDDLVGQFVPNVEGLVLVANIPNFVHLLPVPFAGYRILLEERLQTLNQVIAEVASRHGATLVDLYGSHEAENPLNIGADGFHPSVRGYRMMARSFAHTLQEAGWELPLLEVD
jgi:lysophospholipase L1-like esterase